MLLFWFNQVLCRGLEWRESYKTVLCLQLVISGLQGHWGKTTVRRLGATVWRFGVWWFFCWRWSWRACQGAFWFVIWWWWSGRLVTAWGYFGIFRIFLWGEKNLVNCFLLGGNGKPNIRRFVDKLPTKIMIEKSFENNSSALQIKFKLILYRMTDWSPFLY